MLKATLFLCLSASPLLAQKAEKPDTIKFSRFQYQQLLELKTQADKITEQQNLTLRTIIAGSRDPKSVEGWSIQLTDSSIVLIPPKPPVVEPKKP